MKCPTNRLTLPVLMISSLLGAANAQTVPAPQDRPYPGTIQLEVDISNVQQKIFQVHERIPMTRDTGNPGQLTVLYPKWIPGNHSTTGPVNLLAGLKFSAAGKPLEWKRDPLDMYAFHVTVPDGIAEIDAAYQFLTPLDSSQGRITATPEIAGIQWNTVVLYPAGYYARQIQFQPSVTLPEGWKFASALETLQQEGGTVKFKTLALDELADSPLMAGQHYARFDLDPKAAVPVYLDVFADEPADLAVKPEQLAAHRALVQQAYRLFGAHHYQHYDFLFALSDEFSGIGLEHHQSSEDALKANYFTEWDKTSMQRDLLAHEYVHSWNGKFRRPADLWTPNYNVPMQNSLLWVYEGQTEFWGWVLATRSGLISDAILRDCLADMAALLDHSAGRQWRNLQDTTNQPIINYRGSAPWPSWQRGVDYYAEGVLIWLDVDSKLRELSAGRRSLNDFAPLFFGGHDGSHVPLTYTFEDVVATLNKVQPFDWAEFLRARLDTHQPGAPLDGLTRSGWKLVYSDQESEFQTQSEAQYEFSDFSWSLGITLDKAGHLVNVQWDGPAFKAMLSSGMTLVAVNGHSYSAEALKAAIRAAQSGKTPVELLLKQGGRYLRVAVDYHEGLRYPHLERISGTTDRLATLLQPLK